MPRPLGHNPLLPAGGWLEMLHARTHTVPASIDRNQPPPASLATLHAFAPAPCRPARLRLPRALHCLRGAGPMAATSVYSIEPFASPGPVFRRRSKAGGECLPPGFDLQCICCHHGVSVADRRRVLPGPVPSYLLTLPFTLFLPHSTYPANHTGTALHAPAAPHLTAATGRLESSLAGPLRAGSTTSPHVAPVQTAVRAALIAAPGCSLR